MIDNVKVSYCQLCVRDETWWIDWDRLSPQVAAWVEVARPRLQSEVKKVRVPVFFIFRREMLRIKTSSTFDNFVWIPALRNSTIAVVVFKRRAVFRETDGFLLSAVHFKIFGIPERGESRVHSVACWGSELQCRDQNYGGRGETSRAADFHYKAKGTPP